MSTSLTAVQQVEFDALVKAQYQSLGFLLRDTVPRKTRCNRRNGLFS